MVTFREKILGIFFIVIIFFGCNEIKDSYYKNIDAARKDGALERGWIPSILPDSSYDIYERHNIDTNFLWIRFNFDPKDVKTLIAQLKEIYLFEIETINFKSPGSVNWWPKHLNKESFKSKKADLKIFRHKRIIKNAKNLQKIVDSFVVIDWNSNTAYYWQYES